MPFAFNLEAQQSHRELFKSMDQERSYWFSHWREVSDFFLPRRYPWLMTQSEVRTGSRRSTKLLDSTSTKAIRTLASGMMNGITSPARPWFRLRIAGFDEESLTQESKLYLEEVSRRMYLILAESNFYNAMAILYLEWCTFGTASLAIYEDFDDVIRCFNFAVGEFYIAQDDNLRIHRHGRRYVRTVEQIVKQFGIENVSAQVKLDYQAGGAKWGVEREIVHLIEESRKDGLSSGPAKWREVYYELGAETGEYLKVAPFFEWPCVTPRWELLGNDSYATSPAMDALNDVKQLQKIILERGRALEKQVRPPLIVDQQLRNRPKALAAGGITYAPANSQNFGARQAYAVNVNFQELAADIAELKRSVRETCHNHLFNMISDLETVRSATEIDARREEKLVHLGPVLERFYNEGLDPALRRVFGIASRAGLLPEPPSELDKTKIEVQYVSILSDAQRAVGTVAIERFFQFTGGLAGVYPEASLVPNVEELIRDYAEGIGIKATGMHSRKEVAESREGAQSTDELAATADIGNQLAQGAKVLSDADVGGGQNALQALMAGN